MEEAERPLLNWISVQLEETRNMLVKVAEGNAIPFTNYVQTWGWKRCLVYKKSSTDSGDILGLSYPDVIHKFHFGATKVSRRTATTSARFFFCTKFDCVRTLA